MYLDPGFGSMIIQVVVAAIATCGVAVYLMKSKIKTFLTNARIRMLQLKRKDDEDN